MPFYIFSVNYASESREVKTKLIFYALFLPFNPQKERALDAVGFKELKIFKKLFSDLKRMELEI